MHSGRSFSLLATLLALAPTGATARADSPAANPVVVELFTSQGCSSCPPANANLAAIADRPDVLALSFGVTYWDYIGWKDTFAKPEFTNRQYAYEQKLHRATAYTPQMVVNGLLDVVGSQRNAVENALAQAAHPEAIELAVAGTDLQIHMPALASKCNCLITLFGFRSQVDTRVVAGENSGRTLREFQVVRLMRSLGRWKGDAQVLHTSLRGMPADIDGYAVVAQEGTGGRIIASGRSPLASSTQGP